MANTANQSQNYNPLAFFLGAIVVICMILIAISSLTNTALALKNSSQGKSDVAHQQCLNGLTVAAIETGNCTQSDLMKFNDIIYIRETQGVKAAKDSCFTQISSPACMGICVGAINCYYIQ